MRLYDRLPLVSLRLPISVFHPHYSPLVALFLAVPVLFPYVPLPVLTSRSLTAVCWSLLLISLLWLLPELLL